MIVVGGGSSARFGSDKLMEQIAGRSLFEHTIRAVRPYVDRCVVVCRSEHFQMVADIGLGLEITLGGSSRTASEMAGLAVLAGEAELIGVHDAARPLISGTLIESVFTTAGRVGGAVPILEVEAPVIRRSNLQLITDVVTVQTPQVFAADRMMAAFVRAARAGFTGHDTADVMQRFADIPIRGIPGEPGNIKVTFPADLDRVRSVLEEPSRSEPR
jgi:2-C-methyl-D-erythritol 4-phosphate cytidylyltransferase